jgi:hypothetical protein
LNRSNGSGTSRNKQNNRAVLWFSGLPILIADTLPVVCKYMIAGQIVKWRRRFFKFVFS